MVCIFPSHTFNVPPTNLNYIHHTLYTRTQHPANNDIQKVQQWRWTRSNRLLRQGRSGHQGKDRAGQERRPQVQHEPQGHFRRQGADVEDQDHGSEAAKR
ncbi:hypothetical protein B0T17DRAFT_513473 [Bombardia bombarda]|uniref:Uncharacterized protein n=1 Tax=Bombardia bombarda TaxID=252184 RepID=A0AA40CEI6_9PEZI|nr:hypothetical protein B0T17DRAFT_513473 [Bombardia bombarda]